MSPKRIQPFPILLLGLTALCAAFCLTGCDRTTAADRPGSSGRHCKIQFRRDALGAGANLPISPLTDNFNGADTSISCIYKRVMDDWVVVERAGKEVWIPKAVILLVEYQP